MVKNTGTKIPKSIKRASRLAEMRKVVGDWKASGMSAQDYGDSVGVPKTTLHFWSQVVRKTGVPVTGASAQESVVMASAGKENGRFLPLVAADRQPAMTPHGSVSIEIVLKGGCRVSVLGLTMAQVTPMLAALEAGQAC